MKKRAADIVIETLIKNGITQAFSVVGGGSMHLNNAFALRKSEIKTVYAHHEQACSMAAEGYAKLTGKLAAVCVTSGPGGVNALNGVQSAWVDSAPMIVIAGHPRYSTTVEYAGLNVRSIGVQENDIISQVKTITKYAKLVTDPLAVRREVQRAIDIAMDGRRGPVWLSFPLDVQGALVEETELYENESFISELSAPTPDEIDDLFNAISGAKRPCILTGSGIVTSGARNDYREFLKYYDIPIVGGFSAGDLNSLSEKNFYGMSGTCGQRLGNFILQNADFILVLGNSLWSAQTGFNVEEFASSAKVYMVDAQEDEGKKPGLHIEKVIHTDLKAFFRACCEKGTVIRADKNWYSYCELLRAGLPGYEALRLLPELDGTEAVHPSQFWEIFLKKAQSDAIFAMGNSSCCDPGLFEGLYSDKQRIVYNYKCGSMGMDLPYAIGAKEGSGGSPVYCVTGDGCFMMNIQEMQTIRHYYDDLKLVIFNNNGYGDIRNTCTKYMGGLKNGCDPESGVSFPDFARIADAFGFEHRKVGCANELNAGIDWLISSNGLCMLEICEKLDKERAPVISSIMNENGEFVTPPLHIMSPLLSDGEMEKYTYREGKNYAE